MLDLSTVSSLATFPLLCLSLTCYTIFQCYYFSRAPVQRTVTNTLVVHLSLLLEVLDLSLCSTVLLPYILPVADLLTQHPLVGCLEWSVFVCVMVAIAILLATISINRLLASLYYGRYEDWSQDLLLGTSLATVYLLPPVIQVHILLQCNTGDVEDFCSPLSRAAVAWHNDNNTATDELIKIIRGKCRGPIVLAYFVTILVVVLLSNISLPIINFYRR